MHRRRRRSLAGRIKRRLRNFELYVFVALGLASFLFFFYSFLFPVVQAWFRP
jgi:hypothetical protein